MEEKIYMVIRTKDTNVLRVLNHMTFIDLERAVLSHIPVVWVCGHILTAIIKHESLKRVLDTEEVRMKLKDAKENLGCADIYIDDDTTTGLSSLTS